MKHHERQLVIRAFAVEVEGGTSPSRSVRAEDFSDEMVEAIRSSEMTATEILPDTVTIDRALALQVLKLVRPFAMPSEYSELPLAVRLAQAAEAFERASPEYGGGIYREVLDEHYSGD